VAIRLAPQLVLLAVVVVVGGCGGEEAPTPKPSSSPTEEGGSPTPGDGAGQATVDGEQTAEATTDPRTVEQVVEAVLTETGTIEQGCSTLVSEAFVRDAYGDVAGCEAARRGAGALARRVAFEQAAESGEAASLTVVPAGGPYDGVVVEVELVRDPRPDGGWLVDSLFADLPPGP
jgi:hypothetical protein